MGYREKRDSLKGFSERVLSPLLALLEKMKVTPNGVTWLGFVFNAVGAAVIAYGYFLYGGLVILFASIFDMVDGALARRLNKKSRFGGFLDSVTDRLSEGALFLGLTIHYSTHAEIAGVILSFCVMFLSFLVSYLRARAGGLKIDCSGGVFTRPERMVVIILGLLTGFVIPALWVIGVLSLITVIQRFTLVNKQAEIKNS